MGPGGGWIDSDSLSKTYLLSKKVKNLNSPYSCVTVQDSWNDLHGMTPKLLSVDITTQTSKPSTTPGPCDRGASFDFASFIGGAILCGACIVIFLCGWKFYRSKKDVKYNEF